MRPLPFYSLPSASPGLQSGVRQGMFSRVAPRLFGAGATIFSMYARVALLSPPYAALTYELPPEFPLEFWQPGLRVAVPLGRGGRGALRAAVLLEICAESGLPQSVPCKSVCWPLENARLLSPELLALTEDLGRRQGLAPVVFSDTSCRRVCAACAHVCAASTRGKRSR